MAEKPSYEELERRVQELEKRESAYKSYREALQKDVTLLELIHDKVPLGYQSLDEKGRFIAVNNAWLDVLGYAREEVIGKSFADFLHPDWRDYFKENFPRFKSVGEVLDFEFEMVKKTGDHILVSFTGKICRNETGFFQQAHCIFHDITERKRVENYQEMGREILQILNEPGDLRKSIHRILSILKTQTKVDAVGLRLQDGDDFPYFAQDGFPPEFLLTENTLLERGKDGGVCRDQDGNVRLECTCGLVMSGKTDPSNPLFTHGGSSWTNDSFPFLDLPSDQDPRLHPRNNCIHQGYASLALIPIRTSERIVGLVQLNDKRKGRFTLEMIEVLEGIAAHIGSALMRKQAEEEIAKRELILNKIFDVLPIGLWFVDKNGKLLRGNPAGVKIWGAEPTVTMEEYGVFKARRLPSGEEIAPDDWALSHTIQKKVTITDELLEIDTFDGQKKIILNYTAPVINDSGEMLGAIVVNNDITHHKQAEAEREKIQAQLHQAQKMESVGRLAGGVAHDFNNMLGVILGHTELALLQTDETHELHDDLKEIQKAAERSADITKQLLAFARKQTISPKQLDLNDTVESMLNMLRRLIGEDIDLVWKPAAHLWPVKMDRSQIDQILANLCINARDAIAGVGKLTIETGIKTFDEEYCNEHPGFVPGDFVQLAVSDNGCGMDKDTQANLFEPFFTTKEVGKGTGLGLATVYGIVKQNDGFINVYSESGSGSTFRIYLSRFLGDDGIAADLTRKKTGAGGTETILLVEDEPSILRMTKMMLEKKGYSVLPAATPGEAIDLAKTHSDKIHLLMTDVVMPEMNGRELAKKITNFHPDIGMLFMSGYTANVIAHHGVLDDGVAFIQKPFSLDDLTEKVRELLDMASDKSHA
jgi:PAS domain S-box-containing protein